MVEKKEDKKEDNPEESKEEKEETKKEGSPEESKETKEEKKEEEEGEIISEEEEVTEEKKEESEPTDMLKSLKSALIKVNAGDVKGLSSILDSLIKNFDKLNQPKPASEPKNDDDVKTLNQAQELLKEASNEIDAKNKEITKLQGEVAKGQVARDRLAELAKAQKDKAIEKLTERKLSLGLISKEDVDNQKAKLEKLSTVIIRDMKEELSNINSVVRREALKGAEPEAKTEKLAKEEAKVRKLMEDAGLKPDTIKEHFKKE